MKLFPHQEAALKATADQNRVAYYLDMGLGKTFIGSEKMLQLCAKANLVVCQKSKIQDWVDHFNQNYGRIANAYDLTSKNGISNYFDHVKCAANASIGIINYDMIWRREELLNLGNFTLMLDESSLIQNPTSKRTKFILKMKPANVILLSGTPTGGKYENLWSQLHLLGWNIGQKVYDTHYVNWKKIEVGGFTHRIVDKADPYKNVERLKQKLREHGAVFQKTEEVFDLPEQNVQIIKVPTTKEYRKFKRDRIITVDSVEFVGDSLLSFRLYQRQLCSAYNPSKVEAFKDLLESTQDRLIVFYQFNCELDALKCVCDAVERPVSIVNGQTKDLYAYENESNSVTLVQYQAGAMGLNLQKANKIVYFSLTEEAELFQQSMKRIHRIGQDRPCFYYLMICENSIEDREILPTLDIRTKWKDELFNVGN